MKKYIQILVGLVIGGLLIWLLFRNTQWHDVFSAMRKVNIFWLTVSTGFIILSFFTRVQRWSYIVRTVKPVRFRHMFSATQIGFLANFTLPARLGEVIRAVALSRLALIPMGKCFAMVALDRVLDLIGLLSVIGITVLVYTPEDRVFPAATLGHEYHFRASMAQWGEMVAAIMLIVIVTSLVLLYVKQAHVLKLSDRLLGLISKRLAEKTHGFLQHFADGLHIFRSASDMAKSIAYTLLTWGVCMLSLTSLLFAFNIHFPWYAPIVMEMLLAVFISVPGPPGFVGQFHAPLIIGVLLLGTNGDDATAKAFAILAHLTNLIPLVFIGLFCMYLERFGVTRISQETSMAESKMKELS